ncbi:hypothetical protein Q1695_000128 [Nippostrongylus brasiliensis]|nr:hypothetical protein Q1695_000128 [Nippostrongylus brasiliensis]
MKSCSVKETDIRRAASLLLTSVTMIVSTGAIVFSIQTLIDMGFETSIIGSHGLLTSASMMFLTGLLALVTTPLGFISAVTKYQSLTFGYIVFVFSTFLLSVVAGWVSMHLRNEVNSGVMLRWMNYSLSYEYGNPNANDLTSAWDVLQEKYSCCGIYGGQNTMEWVTSRWFILYDQWPRPRVPRSCCATCEELHSRFCPSSTLLRQQNTDFVENQNSCLRAQIMCSTIDQQLLVHEDACQRWTNTASGEKYYMHTDGCYKVLVKDLQYYTGGTMLISSLMAVTSLLNTCFSLIFHDITFNRRIQREELL